MEEHSKLLIDLLSSAIRGLKPSSFILTQVDSKHLHNIWNDIYEEALAHEVHTLIYPILSELPSDLRPDNEIMIKWKRGTILSASEQIHHIEMVRMVLEKFHAEGIPVIALKGLVIRDYYPQPDLRTMGDADLLIKKEDIKKAKKLLREMGYVKGEMSIKHIHYYHQNSLSLELHWISIDQDGGKESPNFTNQIWEHVEKTTIGGVPVLKMSIEDQLLHLTIHALTHLRSSGIGLRQICDIVLFLEGNSNNINWNYIMIKADEYLIQNFISLLLTLCDQLFGYEIPDMVSDTMCAIPDTIIDILINEIIHSGVYGRRTREQETNVRINKYINIANESTKTAGIYKLQHIVSFLFPSVQKLNYHYKYAKKLPILLPIAWMHRGINNIKHMDALKRLRRNEITTTIKARSKLLHWLQLR
ncbi:MAG: hypothetical protein K0S41_2692 [Anaerocolumna sp.]|jgi:hypothetical protein|nr:hypothetical protein [Anaerocolumna sp.]